MKKSLSILAAALLMLSAGATAAFAQDAPAGQSGNTGSASSGMETVKERAGNAVDKVKEVAGDVAAVTRRGLHAAGQKIEQATSKAKSKGAAAADETRDKSSGLVTKQPAPEADANAAAAADATLVRTGPSLQERTGDAKNAIEDKAGNAMK